MYRQNHHHHHHHRHHHHGGEGGGARISMPSKNKKKTRSKTNKPQDARETDCKNQMTRKWRTKMIITLQTTQMTKLKKKKKVRTKLTQQQQQQNSQHQRQIFPIYRTFSRRRGSNKLQRQQRRHSRERENRRLHEHDFVLSSLDQDRLASECVTFYQLGCGGSTVIEPHCD